MKHTDFMTIAGKEWPAMAEEEKVPFNEKAQVDKERFQRELKEWKEKGYYTLPDGSKSNDKSKKGTNKAKRLEPNDKDSDNLSDGND